MNKDQLIGGRKQLANSWISILFAYQLCMLSFFLLYPASWEIYMQVKKQQLEPDMEQLNNSKLGKEYDKAIYCHLAYLTYMQSTSWNAGLDES